MPSGSTQCSCRIHAGKATRIEAINVNQRKEQKGPMNIRKRGVMKGEEAEESWGPGERWGWGSGTAPGADGWISADGDRGPEKRKRDGRSLKGREHGLLPLHASSLSCSCSEQEAGKHPSALLFLPSRSSSSGDRGPVTSPVALTSTGVQYQELAPPL